jgi:bifunctional non-homologous end joining protein LigD
VKPYSRPGNDLTRRFPRITEAVARLRARTCIIDGEAVACGPDGIACFDLIWDWDHDEQVFLRAFDLIELNGDDLRREPLICRKSTLAVALARGGDGIELNDHMEHEEAELVFSARLQARIRRHRLETDGLALSVRSLA